MRQKDLVYEWIRRGANRGMTQAIEHDEPNHSILRFLVDSHQVEYPLGFQCGAVHRQPDPFNQPNDPIGVTDISRSETHGQISSHRHAAANRFTVEPFAIAQASFDRMPEGMAEIQNLAQPALTLIRRNNLCLDLA